MIAITVAVPRISTKSICDLRTGEAITISVLSPSCSQPNYSGSAIVISRRAVLT